MELNWLNSIYFKKIRIYYRALNDGYVRGWPPRKARAILKGIIHSASPCLDNKAIDCNQCPYQLECVYFRLIEEKRQTDYLPYLIQMDHYRSWLGKMREGGLYSFDLVLLGKYSELADNVVGYIKSKPLVSIKCIDHRDIALDLESTQLLHKTEVVTMSDILEQFPTINSNSVVRKLSMDFVTPLNITYRQRTLTDPDEIDFRAIIELMWRRLGGIATAYCEANEVSRWLSEYEGYISKVRLTYSRGNFRFVSREAVKTNGRGVVREKIGGFLGNLTLEGELTMFFPLIAMAEALHVGNKTTQGLGQYRITDICTA